PSDAVRREPIAFLFGSGDDCGEAPSGGCQPLDAALASAGTDLADAWSDAARPARGRLLRQVHRASAWERAGLAPDEIFADGEGAIAAAAVAGLISFEAALALADALDR